MVNSSTHALRGPLEHDVRTQIVLAATEHFRHYGYEKTTVSDLAKSIGFSKAYIYKFFASKQAIGELICSNCLSQIEADVQEALARVQRPPEKLRALVTVIVESSLRLFLEDRRLYEIAAAAATERWGSVDAYEVRIRDLITRLVQEGRDAGDFERKTPLDEAARSLYMVLLPYINPVTLQHLAGTYREAPTSLAGIILRSLSLRPL